MAQKYPLKKQCPEGGCNECGETISPSKLGHDISYLAEAGQRRASCNILLLLSKIRSQLDMGDPNMGDPRKNTVAGCRKEIQETHKATAIECALKQILKDIPS